MQTWFDNNLRDVERDLSDMGRRQMPFVISVALNDTATDIQKNETKRLSRKLDRPTPFTKRAWAVRRSSKRRLTARVYARPIQARYLSVLEDGGTRTPKRRALVTPANIRLNKYGNMARGGVKRAAAAKNTFSGTPNGHRGGPGIYKRTGRNKKLVKLVSFVKRARYRKRLGFETSAEQTAMRRFPHHFERALLKAWKTRRR